MRDKKGVELAWSKTAGLLIMLIGFIAILVVIYALRSTVDKEQPRILCQTSNGFRARNALTIGDINKIMNEKIPLGPLKCKITNFTVQTEKDLADRIAYTWEDFLMGEYTWMFPDYDQDCMVYYSFTLENDAPPISANDFTNKLKQMTYKLDPKTGDPITYLDYVQNYAGEGKVIVDNTLGAFAPGQIYGIAIVSPILPQDRSLYWSAKTFLNGLYQSYWVGKTPMDYPEHNVIIIGDLNKIQNSGECFGI
ncbi:hypothetical protein KY330_00755 [Candidatus Woesearchaeota archaeon]|nr:hypothetical protein [Candidatus Woesearchaeota archaeon]